jgi:hypothetical protein
VSGATSSGKVADKSGAVVPSAYILIRNQDPGIETDVTANGAGFYMAPNLQPEPYQVTASAPGFSAAVDNRIVPTMGEHLPLNFNFDVGAVTGRVEVTGAAPRVEPEFSTLSELVNAETVVLLPLNGRDWTELQPGVVAINTQQPPDGSSSRSSRGNGAQMSTSGTRPQLMAVGMTAEKAAELTTVNPAAVFDFGIPISAR